MTTARYKSSIFGVHELLVNIEPNDDVRFTIGKGTESGRAVNLSQKDARDLISLLLDATAAEPHEEVDIVDELQGLYLQATRERSHHYVASVAQRAIVTIRNLRRNDARTEHEEAMKSHLEHVRDLDVAMHGENASKRPLLIDIKHDLMMMIQVIKALGIFNGWAKWRHIKRNEEYMVITHSAAAQWSGQKIYQINDPDVEHLQWTIYINKNGKWILRPTMEFMDGRFERT